VMWGGQGCIGAVSSLGLRGQIVGGYRLNWFVLVFDFRLAFVERGLGGGKKWVA